MAWAGRLQPAGGRWHQGARSPGPLAGARRSRRTTGSSRLTPPPRTRPVRSPRLPWPACPAARTACGAASARRAGWRELRPAGRRGKPRRAEGRRRRSAAACDAGPGLTGLWSGPAWRTGLRNGSARRTGLRNGSARRTGLGGLRYGSARRTGLRYGSTWWTRLTGLRDDSTWRTDLAGLRGGSARSAGPGGLRYGSTCGGGLGGWTSFESSVVPAAYAPLSYGGRPASSRAAADARGRVRAPVTEATVAHVDC
jgi:hypothetical protein